MRRLLFTNATRYRRLPAALFFCGPFSELNVWRKRLDLNGMTSFHYWESWTEKEKLMKDRKSRLQEQDKDALH